MGEWAADLLGGSGAEQLSGGMHILLLLTLVVLAPAVLVLTTSFTRILIVLGFLRHALGAPSIPPNMVLIPLALFLTLLSMEPVVDRVHERAVKPALAGSIQPMEAYARAAEPLREFMLRHTRQKDLETLLAVSGRSIPKTVSEVPDRVLIPAFALSELRAAFAIGFTVFLAFLAVDLVVAGVLMALGMFMVPPLTISLPLKILVFVLADGWNLVARSLIEGVRGTTP